MYNMQTMDNGFITYGSARLSDLEDVINDAFNASTAPKGCGLLLIDFFVNLNLACGKVQNFFVIVFRYAKRIEIAEDYKYCVKAVSSSDYVDVIKQMTDSGYEYLTIMQTGQINFIALFRKVK